jgi:hypothetical protein
MRRRFERDPNTGLLLPDPSIWAPRAPARGVLGMRRGGFGGGGTPPPTFALAQAAHTSNFDAQDPLSPQPQLTGVTAGHSLIFIIGTTGDSNPGTQVPVPTDSAGQAWSTAVRPVATGNVGGIDAVATAIFYLLNANAGTHTLSVDFGAQNYGNFTFLEANLQFTGFDQSASNNANNDTSPGSTGTTPATTVNDEVSFVLWVTNTTGSGLGNSNFSLPANYTNLYVEQATNAHTGARHAWRQLSATGTQSASITWDAGAMTAWQAAIATFKLT